MFLNEFCIKLQKSLSQKMNVLAEIVSQKSENLSNQEILKTFSKISQKKQVYRNPKHFQSTKSGFIVEPVQTFEALFYIGHNY